MKFYLGKIPVLKLGSVFYWNGKKYKVTNNNKHNANISDKNSATLGVKAIENNSSNS